MSITPFEKNEVGNTTCIESDEYYKKRIENDPHSARLYCDYAEYLVYKHKNYDLAEEYLLLALEIDPQNGPCHSRYAVFLETIRKDYDKAEEHYKLSLDAKSDYYPTILCNYAIFLYLIRRNYDNAEEYFRRALEVDSENVNCLCRFAIFLYSIRQDKVKAEECYRQARHKLKQVLEPKSDVSDELLSCDYCILSLNNNDASVCLEPLDKIEKNAKVLLMYYFFKFILETEKREDCTRQIDDLLNSSARCEDWVFGHLLESEHIKNDPDYGKIKSFAERINEPFQKVHSVDEA